MSFEMFRLWLLFAILQCGFVSPLVNVDHQSAWDSLLLLDAQLAADADPSCLNHKSRMQINRLPSIIFTLEFTHYVTVGIRTYSFYPKGGEDIAKSPFFDKSKPTVILVHSELDSQPHLLTGTALKAALNRNGPHNILAVDCRKELIQMKTRAELTRLIGEGLAVALKDLVDTGYDVNNIHLIGHEIGAHVVGFAGKSFNLLTKGTLLPRITALNPSSSCYENVSERGRLSARDASYVEVIHTISGTDMKKPIGDVDFYLVDVIPTSSLFEKWHSMIWRFYAETLRNSSLFQGVECDSVIKFNSGVCSSPNRPTAILGYRKNESVTGSYFMRLQVRPPYGLGESGLRPLRSQR